MNWKRIMPFYNCGWALIKMPLKFYECNYKVSSANGLVPLHKAGETGKKFHREKSWSNGTRIKPGSITQKYFSVKE